ncbi:hypothetical protein DL95DRAFT_454705 [Leptodontidium sp. 2 PMI_412]|nr:hypothetical protein DL95DRAFT_454705 [Leptodontidium sp. 2 PMI_412]
MKLSTTLLILTLSTLSLAAPAPAPAPAPEPLRKERPWPYRYYWGYYPGKRSLSESTEAEVEVAKRAIPTIVNFRPDHMTKVDFAIPVATPTFVPTINLDPLRKPVIDPAAPTPTSVLTFDPNTFKKPIVVPNPELVWGLHKVPEGEVVENSFAAEAELEVAK